jgi:hypothetical protein
MNAFLKALHFLLATVGIYIAIVASATFLNFTGSPVIQRLVPLRNPGGPSHSLLRFREASASGPVDVVFLGASHTYRGFDPRIFACNGLTSMNLGSSAQSPLNTLALLERHLGTLKPKLVLYEIYQTALAIDGMESFYDILSNTHVDKPMVEMAWNLRHPQAWTALLSTALRNFRIPMSSHVQRGKEGRDDTYLEGGYVQTRATFPEVRLARLQSASGQMEFPFDHRQFEFFSQCIELVRSHGAVFACCSYPIPVETRKALAGYEDKQRTIGLFLKKCAVPFKDFNENMTLDTAKNYYDEVHLNQAGVELFNPALIEWLRSEKILPKPSSRDINHLHQSSKT